SAPRTESSTWSGAPGTTPASCAASAATSPSGTRSRRGCGNWSRSSRADPRGAGMRLLFVHYVYEDRGSAQDLHHFVLTARELGHEVALYGPPNPRSSFNFSPEVASADAVVFIFEWTTNLQFGDRLDWARLVAAVPRQRRVVIDCDGTYNAALSVVGDHTHPGAEASRRWVEVCDALSDKVYQPTLHPLRPNVRTHFFHAYHAGWEVPLDFCGKEFDLFYVGNNWFRWRAFRKLFGAVEPVRRQVGRIGLVGQGWGAAPPWANPSISEGASYSARDYLNELAMEVMPPVHFSEVISQMSRGVIHPVIYRPLFTRLRLVTCRTFETFAANTIPLFGPEEGYVAEIYGEPALELMLPAAGGGEKILDMLRRPEHYAGVVRAVRRHLAEKHSYAVRLRELVEIVEG